MSKAKQLSHKFNLHKIIRERNFEHYKINSQKAPRACFILLLEPYNTRIFYALHGQKNRVGIGRIFFTVAYL